MIPLAVTLTNTFGQGPQRSSVFYGGTTEIRLKDQYFFSLSVFAPWIPGAEGGFGPKFLAWTATPIAQGDVPFRYELCTYPTSLFDSPLTLRQLQRPALAKALWAKLSPGAKTLPEGNVQYVLDGGALLHRVPWPRGSPTCVRLILHLRA